MTAGEPSKAMDVRPSPIAGQWYTDDPLRLASSIDEYIREASLPPIEGNVVAIMAPHAGHRYSGPVAGYAFSALYGLKPEVVAVVSPMHYPYTQPLLSSAHTAYSTPLGMLEIDQVLLMKLDEQLKQRLGFGLALVKRDPEHSLEIELPFLQRALEGPFKLLPVMVRDQSQRVAHSLGLALAETLRGVNSLLVASTDLSHFYPQSVAQALDQNLLERVGAMDPEGVLRIEEEGKGFACGRGALAAVIWAAEALGANQARILHHATSGAVTGDYHEVVGYGAAVFTHA